MRPAAFSLAALIVAVAGLILTWRRLFYGMDLQDESYYVLLPWRWVLGDKPFVHEQNLLQFPAMLTYPFVKVFGIVRGNDPTGLMLYTRHLYLVLMICTAVMVFLLLRRLVWWQLALLAAGLYVTYIFWATPQLSYNTFALALLTISAALMGRVVAGFGGPRAALAAGGVMGLAVVAYPSLLALVPFFAILFAFAHGRRVAAAVAEGALVHVADPPGQPTGLAAWRTLRMWVLGGLLVLVPIGLIALSFGLENLQRSWQKQMAGAHTINQLGGSAKALDVAQGVERFIWSFPYLVIAALLIYLMYRRWPRVGRTLLALVPFGLWLAGQRDSMAASGYVLIFCLLAPYLYLFIPSDRREIGARLLIAVWVPSLLAGAMTAYTSSFGYVNAAVGLSAGVMVSGLFLAQALAATGRGPTEAAYITQVARLDGSGARPDGRVAYGASGDRPAGGKRPWLALVVLAAIVAVTVSFQFQFQQRGIPYGELTSRFSSGPWWGISVTPQRRTVMDDFERDLRAQSRPDDQLLIFIWSEGYYLYWTGAIAADTYWINRAPDGGLPPSTVAYYRKYRVVPTLAVHLMPTSGMSEEQIAAADAGLGYPPTLVRPTYVFYRKPAGESTGEVIRRLSGP